MNPLTSLFTLITVAFSLVIRAWGASHKHTSPIPLPDQNRVDLSAPTDDAFDVSAEALGCADAPDPATRPINLAAIFLFQV